MRKTLPISKLFGTPISKPPAKLAATPPATSAATPPATSAATLAATPPATSAATPPAKSAATPIVKQPTTSIAKPATEIIPNELKITINTSIPGFQTIKYNSSMTTRNKDKNQICFNPLVKLDKDVIQKIPERIRISEFFNKGLFESLINTHGMTKVKTLKEATNKGYVDHNIKVTLDTIFSTGSVIYINNQPYAIADIQWTKGDWKVDTKEKSVEIDRSKIKNPLMYASIVKEDIISGQQQLQELQKDTPILLSGPNYTGAPVIVPLPVATATVVTPPPASVTPPAAVTPPTAVTPPAPPSSTAIVPFKKPPAPPSSTAIVPFKKPLPPATPLPALPPATPLPPPKPPKPLPALPPAIPLSDRIEILDEEEDENEEEQPLPSNPVLPECILNYNAGTHRPSRALRAYFAEGNYYNLVNEIFLRMDDATKEIIRDYLTASTTVNIDYSSRNLSQIAYAQLIPGMRIVANDGGGDCLFLAVSNAINCYNHDPHGGTRIKSNIPGIVNFTPAQLRQLVYEYLISDKGNLPGKQIIIDANKDLLNERFLQEMTQADGSINYGISNADYLALINNTYVSLPNFLIKKPIIVPDRNLPEFITPFNNINLNDREEIKNYILSNEYWGDQESLNALCDKLKLNIIVIHYNPDLPDVNHRFQIASGNLRTTDICNDWNKYLFLFESNSHYELITFTYTTLVPSKSKATNFVRESKTYTIFDNDYRILPPIYILFFIYGSKYFTSAPRLNAKLLPDIFNSIDTAFLDIIQEANQDTINFFTSFNIFFPGSLRSREVIEITERTLNPVSSSGGANNFIKSEDKRDSSKICYYITIDMELQKGTTLSEEQLSDAKCRQKWNAVRKAYANFTGKKYVIPPVYDYSKNKTQKQPLKTNANQNQNKNNTIKNNKSYLNTSRNNGTRKYNSQELYQGGKRNKTIRNC